MLLTYYRLAAVSSGSLHGCLTSPEQPHGSEWKQMCYNRNSVPFVPAWAVHTTTTTVPKCTHNGARFPKQYVRSTEDLEVSGQCRQPKEQIADRRNCAQRKYYSHSLILGGRD